MSQQHPLVSMKILCGLFGVSRQAWYDAQKRTDKSGAESALILSEVQRIRVELPSVGVEVLHHQLRAFRLQHGIKMGRDKLAKLLRENNLLIRRKPRRAKTTWSSHSLRKYPNLIKERNVSTCNQLWVSDITYIPLVRGFAYLSLITDAYSRKIVGWQLHESLQAEGPLLALKMALKSSRSPLQGLIHHSDRGVQYCCGDYIDLLRSNKVKISMTEQGDPYENALAERINRTIKEDMLLNRAFADFTSAEQKVRRAIANYNTLRPHGSCNYLTPEQAHTRVGPLPLRWRKSRQRQPQKVQGKDLRATS